MREFKSLRRPLGQDRSSVGVEEEGVSSIIQTAKGTHPCVIHILGNFPSLSLCSFSPVCTVVLSWKSITFLSKRAGRDHLEKGKKEKWILRGKNFQLNSFNYFNVSHLSPQSQLDEIF